MPDAIVPKDDKRPRVEVFVDNSNVVYSFLNWLRQRPEAKMNVGEKLMKTVSVGGKKGQLDYTTLLAILERGRKVERRVLVASSPLWQGLDVAAQWVRNFLYFSLSSRVLSVFISRGTKSRFYSEFLVRPIHLLDQPFSTQRNRTRVLLLARTRRRRRISRDCRNTRLRRDR